MNNQILCRTLTNTLRSFYIDDLADAQEKARLLSLDPENLTPVFLITERKQRIAYISGHAYMDANAESITTREAIRTRATTRAASLIAKHAATPAPIVGAPTS